MNILIIGNGFDLAHNLPTKYTHFLDFIKIIRQVMGDQKIIDWGKVDFQIRELVEKKMGNIPNNLFSQKKMWSALLDNNIWIEYFLHSKSYAQENWIDFEKEISKIIQSVDIDMQGQNLEDEIDELTNGYLKNTYLYRGYEALFESMKGERGGKQNITFKKLRDDLHKDLNRFIRAFEIYLTEYVEKIDTQKRSPDIKRIRVDHVLSFNYTDIFSKWYKVAGGVREKEPGFYDYIHGKANINNSIDTNNMVLGIDEYLDDNRKNKDTEFIMFKKFYQRIWKQTGCKYKEWVEEIQRDYGANRHNLYIFGHSLDITDGDILRELILNNNVKTVIFYPDRDELGRKIANLVKVIGQEELIKRTGGRAKTIEFMQQQGMLEKREINLNIPSFLLNSW